jgi:hypothetical protein
LDLAITHPIDETQGDVGVEALQEGQHVIEEEESKIDAPITEPQILPEIEAQDKEEPTLEEPYVPSTQQPQEEDVQPTSIEDQEEIPIVQEEPTDPIQRLDKLPQDDDVYAPFEVPTEHKVDPKNVEPSFEEVPRSLDLPITHPIDETSIKQSQDEDVQPTCTEEEEKTPIVKEEAIDPTQRLEKLPQDDDVHPPFEVPIEHRVELKEVDPLKKRKGILDSRPWKKVNMLSRKRSPKMMLQLQRPKFYLRLKLKTNKSQRLKSHMSLLVNNHKRKMSNPHLLRTRKRFQLSRKRRPIPFKNLTSFHKTMMCTHHFKSQ